MRSVKLAGVLANGIRSQRPIGINEETVRTLRFVGVTDPPDLRRILICNRAVRSKEKEDRPGALPGVLDRSVGDPFDILQFMLRAVAGEPHRNNGYRQNCGKGDSCSNCGDMGHLV
jgi:hypothetical protein